MSGLLTGCESPTEPSGELAFPLCEPSAALTIRCPAGAGQCLLVSDDDIADALFLFGGAPAGLQPWGGRALGMRKVPVDDIEALARVDDQKLLIMGSHSRKENCKPVPGRQRFFTARLTEDGLQPLGRVIQAPSSDAAAILETARKERCTVSW